MSGVRWAKPVDDTGLAEAKAFVDTPGKAVKTGLSKEDADKLKKALEEQGAGVELA